MPQIATVKRSAARLEITYDGAPEFRPIPATALEAAANAPVPVIRVDGRTYYALDNGVWFFSESAEGPWIAATSVPPVIYTIPRSHPLHYVTYVRVYDAVGDEVYVGYTPGYVGSYVTPESTVVYGTGWYYAPVDRHCLVRAAGDVGLRLQLLLFLVESVAVACMVARLEAGAVLPSGVGPVAVRPRRGENFRRRSRGAASGRADMATALWSGRSDLRSQRIPRESRDRGRYLSPLGPTRCTDSPLCGACGHTDRGAWD